LKNSTELLLSPIVTFTCSSLKANSPGDGRKSSITLTSPRGSFVYLIFFFIDSLSLSPIARPNDANHTFSICKADRHYFISYFAKTIVAFFRSTVANILSNHTIGIVKSVLSHRKCNSVPPFGSLGPYWDSIKTSFGHTDILSTIMINCNIIIHHFIWSYNIYYELKSIAPSESCLFFLKFLHERI